MCVSFYGGSRVEIEIGPGRVLGRDFSSQICVSSLDDLLTVIHINELLFLSVFFHNGLCDFLTNREPRLFAHFHEVLKGHLPLRVTKPLINPLHMIIRQLSPFFPLIIRPQILNKPRSINLYRVLRKPLDDFTVLGGGLGLAVEFADSGDHGDGHFGGVLLFDELGEVEGEGFAAGSAAVARGEGFAHVGWVGDKVIDRD